MDKRVPCLLRSFEVEKSWKDIASIYDVERDTRSVRQYKSASVVKFGSDPLIIPVLLCAHQRLAEGWMEQYIRPCELVHNVVLSQHEHVVRSDKFAW